MRRPPLFSAVEGSESGAGATSRPLTGSATGDGSARVALLTDLGVRGRLMAVSGRESSTAVWRWAGALTFRLVMDVQRPGTC